MHHHNKDLFILTLGAPVSSSPFLRFHEKKTISYARLLGNLYNTKGLF